MQYENWKIIFIQYDNIGVIIMFRFYQLLKFYEKISTNGLVLVKIFWTHSRQNDVPSNSVSTILFCFYYLYNDNSVKLLFVLLKLNSVSGISITTTVYFSKNIPTASTTAEHWENLPKILLTNLDRHASFSNRKRTGYRFLLPLLVTKNKPVV